jgi:predicted NodU family carbamoyl transferase
MGKNALGIEMEIAWATLDSFTVHNFPCYEDGGNCVGAARYKDPSDNVDHIKQRLANDKKNSVGGIRG